MIFLANKPLKSACFIGDKNLFSSGNRKEIKSKNKYFAEIYLSIGCNIT